MCARNAGQDGDGGGVISRRSGGRVGPRPARAPPGWRVRSYSRRPATVAPVTSACGPSTIEQASLQGVREQKKIALLRRKRTKHGSRLQTDEKKDWEPSTKIRPRTKRRTKSLLGLAHEPTRPSDRRNSMFAANTVDEGSALASHPAAHARRPTPPPSAEATTTGRSPRTPPSAPHTRGSAFRGLTDGASAAAASAAAAAFARMPAAAFALPAAVATLAARRSAAAATEAAAAACRRSCC